MEFAEIKREIKRLQEEAKSRAKTVFDEKIKEVFEAHPKLESFSWTAYTPYFNDGDTCEFGVYHDDLDMQFDGEEIKGINEWAFGADGKQYHEKEQSLVGLKEAYAAAHKFLGAFDDDDFLNLFGDHVKVTASRPGKTDVEEWEHD